MTICKDIRILKYKLRHPDDSEDPQNVGLSSEDEATGMNEEIGIACKVTVSRPSPTTNPSPVTASKLTRPATPPTGPAEPPEGNVKLRKDEVVINKAVLWGIKWRAELALKGQAPASFSVGIATSWDMPFEISQLAKHSVNCDLCRKDLPTPKALRHHLRMHRGKTNYICEK